VKRGPSAPVKFTLRLITMTCRDKRESGNPRLSSKVDLDQNSNRKKKDLRIKFKSPMALNSVSQDLISYNKPTLYPRKARRDMRFSLRLKSANSNIIS